MCVRVCVCGVGERDGKDQKMKDGIRGIKKMTTMEGEANMI